MIAGATSVSSHDFILAANRRRFSNLKCEALGPAGGEARPGFSGDAPLLAVFERVDDEKADDLPHLFRDLDVVQIRFAHREGESFLDRNAETKTWVVIVHEINAVAIKETRRWPGVDCVLFLEGSGDSEIH